MATQWGQHWIFGTGGGSPGPSVGWYFVRGFPSEPAGQGFLPYISVIPTVSDEVNSGVQWTLTGGGYPYWTTLGISTQWVNLDPDGGLTYFIVVQNNFAEGFEYAFVEADL
jgi:hypothetical protein